MKFFYALSLFSIFTSSTLFGTVDQDEWTLITPHSHVIDMETFEINGSFFDFVSVRHDGGSFLILQDRISEAQYKAVTKIPLGPPIRVTYQDALHFIQTFNRIIHKQNPHITFELPSNEQWSFAAEGDIRSETEAGFENKYGASMRGSHNGEWTSTLYNHNIPEYFTLRGYQTNFLDWTSWFQSSKKQHQDRKAEFRLIGNFQKN